MNGIRTDLPATPKVGDVEAQELDVGQAGAAADRHGEDRHAPHPQPGGGLHRRRALVPVAVGGQHDAAQVLDLLAARRASGSFRSVPCPACGSENGWITTFIRSRSLFQDGGLGQAARSPRGAWSRWPPR